MSAPAERRCQRACSCAPTHGMPRSTSIWYNSVFAPVWGSCNHEEAGCTYFACNRAFILHKILSTVLSHAVDMVATLYTTDVRRAPFRRASVISWLQTSVESRCVSSEGEEHGEARTTRKGP